MRIAFADPPYPGQSKKHYGDHPDYAGEVDHAELIARVLVAMLVLGTFGTFVRELIGRRK